MKMIRAVFPLHRALIPMMAATAATLVAGCTFIIQNDDERGNGALGCDDGDDSVPRDFVLKLSDMGFHSTHRVEIRVIGQGDTAVARAVLDTMAGTAATVRLPNALYPGPHVIDFYADVNANNRFDVPPDDHAWRLEPCTSGVYEFSHNTNFFNIEDPPPLSVGRDFVLSVNGMGIHGGDMMEVHVVDPDSGRTVGLYRLAELQTDNFEFVIPGIVEPGVPYVVVFFADVNGNLRYDPPPTDHAWRLEAVANADGIFLDFTHNIQFIDISEELGITAP